MCKLRKIKNTVNEYVKLLVEHPEVLKNNYKYYLNEINALEKQINLYIDNYCNSFQSWCDTSVNVFYVDETNIFVKLKKSFLMSVVNHHLSKISYNLAVCSILNDNLDFIKKRLTQYEYFS